MVETAENALAFARVKNCYQLERNQPVDYKEWGMPAHMVNAYTTQKNLISLSPAAILLHSMTASVASANYGGIGVASYCSAKFLMPLTQMVLPLMKMVAKDWWTESDYAAFKKCV